MSDKDEVWMVVITLSPSQATFIGIFTPILASMALSVSWMFSGFAA